MKILKKKIIIIGGDPNSINSEIIFKSWKKISKSLRKRIYLICSYELLKKQLKILKFNLKIKKVKTLEEGSSFEGLKIIDVKLDFKEPFKVNRINAAYYIKNCLNLGHKLALNRKTTGLINCAIDKRLFTRNKMGVTEILAKKCKIKKNSEVMLIRNRVFSVSPLTTHLDIKDISKNLKKKIIILKIKTIIEYFKKTHNKNPKIGILGLNPHNAELRNNSEEVKEIIPAIKFLKKRGFNVNGPFVSDTIFINDYKKFDVVIGMYHDQVLAPFKTIFKFNAINVTLGLKYIRCSPDHGVALNLLKKNKANASSLVQCINYLNKFGK